MTKNDLRPIVVDNEAYLWKLKNYEDVWAGILVVYSALHKQGRLEVHYPYDDYWEWNNITLALVDEQSKRNLNIHEPEPTTRVIRHARNELGWNPNAQQSPFIIEHGYEILKQVGYRAKPYASKKVMPITLDELKEKSRRD